MPRSSVHRATPEFFANSYVAITHIILCSIQYHAHAYVATNRICVSLLCIGKVQVEIQWLHTVISTGEGHVDVA